MKDLRGSVVFPKGFLRDNGQFRSIVFEKLDESWFIGIPADDKLHRLFVQQLCHVVKLMHACNIVHMDLMPCNIAWKKGEDGKSVLIKLLDFDAATNLPFRVGDKLKSLALTNRKVFMWNDDLCPDVRFDCWYCFLYDELPAEFRASADVSGPSSPGEVNGAFLDWLTKQDLKALHSKFDTTFPILQELNLSVW